jgi:cytidylate kinase
LGAQVVCISRTLGGGGETVGRLVADRLGFRYVDEEIIALASDKAQVNPGLVAEAEHRKPLLDRLLDALAANTPVEPLPYVAAISGGIAYYGAEIPVMPPALLPNFRELIREAISEIAAQGRVVIVAHAASMALAGAEGVLRVLVTASEKTRIDRLLAGGQVANESEASRAVKHSDRERRDYLRDFYQVHEELPTHYDLVINTDFLPAERAANLVVSAAG